MMRFLLTRLLRDEHGQDLIEYALLTAGIGLAGIAMWPAITAAIGVAYQAFDSGTQNIWEMPDPGAGL
jgi:Flp pilus assembly pilin Flp